MYQGAITRVKSTRGISEQFEVGIGLHQGSALSPFLFIMLVDTISQNVRTELPWELLYADDLAIIDITSTDTQNRLESWQKVLTDNGLKINVAKTEHLVRCLSVLNVHFCKKSPKLAQMTFDRYLSNPDIGRTFWDGLTDSNQHKSKMATGEIGIVVYVLAS